MQFEYVKSPTPGKKEDRTKTPGQGDQPSTAVVEPLSADEIASNTKDLYKSMGWGDAPPEAQTRPASMPAAEPPPAAPAAPAAAPAAPAATPPPPARTESEPGPSTAQIISQAARETAREVAQALRPAEPERPVEPEIELSEEDKKDLPVLQYLERTNPKKYGGLVAATMKYFKDHYEYAQGWLEANPGKDYNPDDEEHAGWIAEHQPPNVSREEIDDARVDMRVEAKFNAEIKPKFDQQEAERAFQASLPTIAGEVDNAVKMLVRGVDPALADLLKDASGKEVLSDATIAKVDEADPIAKEIMDKIVGEELEPMILELGKTVNIPGYKLTPGRNPVHAQISNFVAEKEAQLRKAPQHEQVLDGKRWVSLDEYARLFKGIQNGRGNADEKAQAVADLDRSVWCLDDQMIKELMVDYCIIKAKGLIAKEDARAQKKYGTTRKAGGTAPATTAAQPPQPPPPSGGKPRPPSLGGQSVDVTTQNPSGGTQKTFSQEATDVMFSR
jgi:hypothetical protein